MSRIQEDWVIYQAKSKRGRFLQEFLHLIANLQLSTSLGYRFFIRDLKAQYKNSFLGFLWILIPPIMTAILWIVLKGANIIVDVEGEIPYALYVLISILLWQIFSESVLLPLNQVKAGKSLLTKLNFPRESLLFAGVFQALFNSSIKVLLILAICLGFGYSISAQTTMIVPGVIGLVVVGFALGVIIVPFALLLDDIRRGLGPLLQVWMYLSAVVYQIPSEGILADVCKVNPMVYLIDVLRSWTIGQSNMDGVYVLVASGIGLVALTLAIVVYKVVMPIIIERSGS